MSSFYRTDPPSPPSPEYNQYLRSANVKTNSILSGLQANNATCVVLLASSPTYTVRLKIYSCLCFSAAHSGFEHH